MDIFPNFFEYPARNGRLGSSLMKAAICSVFADNFQKEVLEETRPVLLLCTYRDHEFSQQLKMLQDFTIETIHDFKVGLLAEEFISAFKEAYGISGTPTYLLLVQGQERGRLLGFAEMKALKDWLGELSVLS
jgi:thioredoxin-like negative regulator of GroEL